MIQLQKSSTTTYRPVPSPLKREFKAHGLTAGAVARYIERSYVQTLNYLKGVAPVPEAIEAKMHELLSEVKAEV